MMYSPPSYPYPVGAETPEEGVKVGFTLLLVLGGAALFVAWLSKIAKPGYEEYEIVVPRSRRRR